MENQVFKFRVILDTQEDVIREIEIPATATFENLHYAIVHAFGFSGNELASFYASNDNWDKGTEIPLMSMNFGLEDDEEEIPLSMTESTLIEYVSTTQSKWLYAYDFLRMWMFYVEYSGVIIAEEEKQYPSISFAFGEAPEETSKEPEVMMDMPMEESNLKGESIDDILNEYSEENFNEGFSSLDDLEEGAY